MFECSMHDLMPDESIVHEVLARVEDSGVGPDGLAYSAYSAIEAASVPLVLCMLNLIFMSDLPVESSTLFAFIAFWPKELQPHS